MLETCVTRDSSERTLGARRDQGTAMKRGEIALFRDKNGAQPLRFSVASDRAAVCESPKRLACVEVQTMGLGFV